MEENNITPVTPNSWTNPSSNQNVDNNLKEMVNEYTKEINELKNEIEILKEEMSKMSGGKIEIPKEENIEVPFMESPFTEATNKDVSIDNNEILESVKEDVPAQEVVEDEIVSPTFEDMLVEKDTVSVVVNRYNTDISATTKGKGAKYVSLTDAEHAKLLSGKIN